MIQMNDIEFEAWFKLIDPDLSFRQLRKNVDGKGKAPIYTVFYKTKGIGMQVEHTSTGWMITQPYSSWWSVKNLQQMEELCRQQLAHFKLHDSIDMSQVARDLAINVQIPSGCRFVVKSWKTPAKDGNLQKIQLEIDKTCTELSYWRHGITIVTKICDPSDPAIYSGTLHFEVLLKYHTFKRGKFSAKKLIPPYQHGLEGVIQKYIQHNLKHKST